MRQLLSLPQPLPNGDRTARSTLSIGRPPSILNPFLSGGTKDVEAASLVIEPLARYNSSGEMVPWLAEEIPTTSNGGVSEDLTSITWKLKKGIKWSDGSELTSADVKFTYEYCTHPEGGCAQVTKFEGVTSVETPDDYTVVVTFGAATPFPYGPFVGGESPILQKAQFEQCMGAKAPECTDANFGPIGTGPFVVEEFKPNDVITFVANDQYRDASKPAFSRVLFKGGGERNCSWSCRSGNRRIRLRLEPAAGTRCDLPDGSRRQRQGRCRFWPAG